MTQPWHAIITVRGGLPWRTVEDICAEQLRERGMRTWVAREAMPTPKRPDLTVPLVRGLVFVRVPVDWTLAEQARGFLRPVRNGYGEPATISQHQIDIMRAACEPLLSRAAAPAKYCPGETVAIRVGAISTIEATIAEVRQGEATVAYELMGKQFRARKPFSDIEKAPSEGA